MNSKHDQALPSQVPAEKTIWPDPSKIKFTLERRDPYSIHLRYESARDVDGTFRKNSRESA